jgi:glucuronokinase
LSEPGPATGRAHARAALLGNPSDGFGGATIAFALEGLVAEVEAGRHSAVVLEADGERLEFADGADLVAEADGGGYPPRGPLALLMAAAKRFADQLGASALALEGAGFRVRLINSSIPPEVGLAGSSAIVIATLRALGALFDRAIPLSQLPAVALACENEELGIAAGPQDRVVQTYGGLLFMDFDPALKAPSGSWAHEPLNPVLLPPLVLAYDRHARGHSGSVHASVRERYHAGDPEVLATMSEIAALAHAGREALLVADLERLAALLDRNFELRRRIYELDRRHVEMLEAARAAGAAANYAGSGGAIVALPRRDASISELQQTLERAGCRALQPLVAAPAGV